jgi:diguanylate cyclase
MINVTPEELGRILATIHEALSLHEQWKDNLLRNFVCRLPLAAADMLEDAHLHCAFGKWFYSKPNAHFRDLSAFKKIDELHLEMHQSARQICFGIKAVGTVPEADYDEFLGCLSRFRNEMLELQQRVTYTLQNIDPLTGAYNNTRLLPDLRTEQERLKSRGAPYSLLLMDIDLKIFNQSHGRNMGDNVLRTAIGSVREALSPSDKVYRYGGAEFVICLPGRKVNEVEEFKETLLKKISEALTAATGEPATSLSIHYSIVELDAKAYLEELLDRSSRSTFAITM